MSTTFSSVEITTTYLANGLEFDQVWVPFGTQTKSWQAIDRHMLYVAVTRTMHCLVVTHCEAIPDI
jgi:DNA helicase II / ATP-dependent DNA helicase PcrA